MVTRIEQFQTADGRVFFNEKEAQRHENDLLTCELDKFINAYFDTGHRLPSYVKAMNIMADDKPMLRTRIKAILCIIGE